MGVFATEADMPEVYRNWAVSFRDSMEEIERFFYVLSKDVRVLIKKEEGKVAAQLCLLPAKLYYREGNTEAEVEAVYIYAVATAPRYRNQGLCTSLLEDAKNLLEKEKKSGILVPADTALQKFYEKRGFRCCFAEEKIVIQAAKEKNTAVLQECSVLDYINHRTRNFKGTCRVEGCVGMIELAVSDFLAKGGKCVELTCDGNKYGILYEDGETVRIKEITTGDGRVAKSIGEMFLQAIGRKEAILQRSQLTYGFQVPDGMVQTGYFNLVLE